MRRSVDTRASAPSSATTSRSAALPVPLPPRRGLPPSPTHSPRPLAQELIEDPTRPVAPPAVDPDLGLPGDLAARPFGAPFRDLFAIDFAQWTFINHGAFGAVARPAMAQAERWRERCEAQPLAFLDRELFPQVVRVLRELARFVGCDAQDLALLPNATAGLNTVLASLRGEVDVVLTLDVGYGSVRRMADRLAEEPGTQHRVVEVGWPPLSRDPVGAVARAAAEVVGEGLRPPLVVVDYVTSATAVQLPVPDIVRACHALGARVLVDGAHALGTVALDLDALGADYFVANCHKWLCGPRGSAVLHVRRDRQAGVRPLAASWGSGQGFTSDFIWDGCRDYSPYLALPAALRLWERVGPERARRHMRETVQAAAGALAAAWNTGTLVPPDQCPAGMALVRVPPLGPAACTSDDAKELQDALHHRFRVECPVKCLRTELWVRISAHVYNEARDYEPLRDAVLALRGERGGREGPSKRGP